MDYVSKTVKIQRPRQQVYDFFADFRELSHLVPPNQVSDLETTEATCSFSVKPVGKVRLQIAYREPVKLIKYSSQEGDPLEFNLWVQLLEATPYETRLRITLRANFNTMIRALLGRKLQKSVDEAALQIAAAFNAQTPLA
ncbi:polyketide cyclase [Bacteroidia bacterium]|nr:polyketide cyclase [Bacteroidia bacterium]